MSDVAGSTVLALAALANASSTMMQITQAVTELEKEQYTRVVKIGVSSSVTVDLLNVYLRKHALLNGAKIELVAGNYDDPVGDVERFVQAGVELIVLLPFFDNLFPFFEAQLEGLEKSIIDAKEAELRQRYRVVFEKARDVPAIYLGTFHRFGSPTDLAGNDVVDIVLTRFNTTLRQEAAAFANIRIIETESIVRTVGQQSSFDARFYFRGKAPYSGAYMNELARRVAAATRGFGGYFYKVLALDCDNTLWGGVIGEDLIDGIKLGPHDYPGNIFWRVQHEFVALERQGILLALVTKNNPNDIAELFQKHPDMVLKESHIVVNKINWDDKATNLRAIARDLNLGLDSIIFLDDSSFECEAVRQQLPQVKTFQVPNSLAEYPGVIAEIKSLFLDGGITAESKGKTQQYRQRASAGELKALFDNQEEYLASLALKVELTRDERASACRISELSQKSNQFNLTTLRYSVAEIKQKMEDDDYAVYSLVVSDKFGSSGLTGVAVIRYHLAVAVVESFFMSCRVIGRGVETSIWTRIVNDAVKQGCKELHANYIPSPKNSQVAGFFDRLGLTLKEEDPEGKRHYSIAFSDFSAPDSSWIEMINVK